MRAALLLPFLFLAAASLFAQGTASPRVSAFSIEAPQLQDSRKIWVYLPQSYENKAKRHYPVLYMCDGQNLFDATTAFAGEWEVDETLDRLRAEVIVIGIEHGGAKRLEELTPFPNDRYGGGKADAYLDFVVHTLKPYVDAHYRTKPGRRHTAIWGSSLGGLTAFYAAVKHPDVFGKAGVFSPAFWFSDAIFELAQQQDVIRTKIVLLCGDAESDEMVPDMHRMARLLDTKRCYCEHLTKEIVVSGGKHNESLWREGFRQTFGWLF